MKSLIVIWRGVDDEHDKNMTTFCHTTAAPYRGKPGTQEAAAAYGSLSESTVTLALIPGMNQLNEEQQQVWEILKKHSPDVIALIEEGRLVEPTKPMAEGKDGKPGEEIPLPETLKSLKPAEALDLIENCVELEVLQSWLNPSEKRGTVRQALSRKINEVQDFQKKVKAARES